MRRPFHSAYSTSTLQTAPTSSMDKTTSLSSYGTKLLHCFWMQKEEYCVSGMNKKRTADCLLLRDNPKISRCAIASVTTNERQRPEHAICITATSGEDVSNQHMEILGECLVIQFHQGTNIHINCSMKTTGQYLSQRQQIKKA